MRTAGDDTIARRTNDTVENSGCTITATVTTRTDPADESVADCA
jgi:hypothetical protein